MQSKILAITTVAVICMAFFANGVNGAAIPSSGEVEHKYTEQNHIENADKQQDIIVHRGVRANAMFNVNNVFSARNAPTVDWDSSKNKRS